MAVSDFLMAISDASRAAFPYLFTSVASYLQAVAVAPGFSFITHETEECHVNRRHAELEGFEMETKVLTKTVEDLQERTNETTILIWMRFQDV